MKASLLIVSFFISFVSLGQTDTGSHAAEHYCIVDIHPVLRNNSVEILVDYGQKMSRGWPVRNFLKDENGKRRYFRSEADAVNFLGASGWKLVNAFPVISGSGSNTRYIFKRTSPWNPDELKRE
jgi:hypothetical protein